MKKIVLVLTIVLLSLSQLIAQTSTFEKGDKAINLGIGIGSPLYSGVGNKGSIPPLSVSYETGVVDNVFDKGVIGVGGYLGYQSYKWSYAGWGWKYSDFIISARGTFHYPLIEKLDTYTGLMLGYNIVTAKEFGNTFFGSNNYSASTGGFVAAWFVGARYYFNNNFGVMGELGYGITYLNLGIVVKI